nr:DNA polymerase I [Oceanococcus sp. HetDA_MAG_MS8]
MSTRIIIDGSGWLYRAFHALPELTNPQGEPSQAVFGFGNMLRKLLRNFGDEPIVVVFDAPGSTFRHELYAEYKAQRPPVPPDLRSQFDPIVELVGVFGLPMVQMNDVEADDVIASLARQTADPVRIVSSDKDLAQLVDERVVLWDVFKNKTLGPAEVEEKFGVPPKLVDQWLALVGDSSDNVPGLKGVGPKTAAKWLMQFGGLQELLAQADSVKGKAGETLRANLEQVELALSLTTLKSDLELSQSWEDLPRRSCDEQALTNFATRWGFNSWLEGSAPQAKPAPPSDAASAAAIEPSTEGLNITSICVQSPDDLEQMCAELRQATLLAVDTETSSLDPLQADLVGLSFAASADKAWYVPVGHNTEQAQLGLDAVRDALATLLGDDGPAHVLQNGKFDAPILQRHDLSLARPWEDTQLLSYVFEAHERHDMDSLAQRWLGHDTIHYEDVAGKGRKQLNFRDVPLDAATEYAAEDAAVTWALHQRLSQAIEQDPQLASIYNDIEKPLAPILAAMEGRGIALDLEALGAADADFSAEIETEEKRCHEIAEGSFNLGSPAQLGQILFDKLGLPVLRKTPKGAPSTAEDVLEELAAEHELPRRILRWRMLSKLRSTYTRALAKAVNPTTQRVHCRFQQAVASTGRLSCADPNLQNIPIRRPEGLRIRECFVAREGWSLLALDYSQIELRLMAHFSEDPLLCAAFADQVDIHRRTAAQVWDLEEDQVSSDQRRAAKAINFGLIYGISAFGLARNLGVDRSEADQIMRRFFGAFPGVKDYMDRVREQAKKDGEVRTLYGRRLILPEIRARNAARRQGAERVAINAPLQGTAADIIKRAMISIDRQLHDESDIVMLLQVHDELVFEVRQGHEEHWAQILQQEMESAAELRVPLEVEWGYGRSWAQAHG